MTDTKSVSPGSLHLIVFHLLVHYDSFSIEGEGRGKQKLVFFAKSHGLTYSSSLPDCLCLPGQASNARPYLEKFNLSPNLKMHFFYFKELLAAAFSFFVL